MKIPKMYLHEYVCCLPLKLEDKIMTEVKKTIASLYLSDDEKIEAVVNANNSKLCDLTDTINLEFV